jgi:hypothetical protein
MALVDNQNDRPASGNQRIISRMCVMIVNTHWASMALSAACMGPCPAFPLSSFRPFRAPAFSVSLQPCATAYGACFGVEARNSTVNCTL